MCVFWCVGFGLGLGLGVFVWVCVCFCVCLCVCVGGDGSLCVCVSHLPGAVAALAAEVLAMSQQTRGAGALEREPGVNEGRGATVMIHEE